ncbi:hypothetical protein [Microcoleus sp. herbarium2]|uniref:hypothetical protein n=1 Tax=Microcoleus sp. herbarium2 TaxID=3055433 RepID=UPI002FD54421
MTAFLRPTVLTRPVLYITTLSPHLLDLPNPRARNSISGDISGFLTNFAQKLGFSQQLEGKQRAIRQVVRTQVRSISIAAQVLTTKQLQNYKARDIEKPG